MKEQTKNTKCVRFSVKEKTEYLAKAEKGDLGRKFISKEKSCLHKLYDFLPKNKLLNSERLEEYFSELEKSGISKSTQRNYAVYINHILDYLGCDDLRLMRRKKLKPITYKSDVIETQNGDRSKVTSVFYGKIQSNVKNLTRARHALVSCWSRQVIMHYVLPMHCVC